MLNNGKDNLGKFDAKSDEAIFLGYSIYSKAYRVFNKRTLTVEQSIHITFNENVPLKIETNEIEDNETTTTIEKNLEDLSLQEKETENQRIETNEISLPREWKYVGSHPKELIIGDPSQGIRTRSKYREEINHIAFVSQIEPHNLEEAELDPNWMMAMH